VVGRGEAEMQAVRRKRRVGACILFLLCNMWFGGYEVLVCSRRSRGCGRCVAELFEDVVLLEGVE